MKKLFLIVGIILVGVVAVISATVWCSCRNVDIEFVHAEGEDIGEPMAFLPVFTPQTGIGQGEPIYDCPNVDLSFTLSATNEAGLRSASMTYLGIPYTLTETAQGSFAFINDAASLTLSGAFQGDPTILEEWGSASVTIAALGITNAVYPCMENIDDRTILENKIHGVVFATNALTDTAQLQLSTIMYRRNVTLTETAAGAGIFTNAGLSANLRQISGQPRFMVSDGMALTNAIFSVRETAPQSGEYRNYNEPIPTDLSEEDLAVPDFAPWRLKITGVIIPALVSGVSLKTTVDYTDKITFSKVGGSLLSDQKFILIPDGDLEAPPPAGYVPIRSDVTTPKRENPKVDSVVATPLLWGCTQTEGKEK